MARNDERRSWRVLPHGPVEPLSENLWRVEGSLPDMPLKRVMTLARLTDGRLVVHSPIALDEVAMRVLEDLGPPAFIIVPNGWHRLDAPAFANRYPDARVLTASGARKRVADVATVSDDVLPEDPNVAFRDLGGTDGREGVLTVRSSDGVTAVLCDAVFNMPHVGGPEGFVLRHVTGSSGGPRVSRITRWFLVKDRAAFLADLEGLATPDLVRVVVAHHEIIDQAPAATLRRVAASLR